MSMVHWLNSPVLMVKPTNICQHVKPRSFHNVSPTFTMVHHHLTNVSPVIACVDHVSPVFTIRWFSPPFHHFSPSLHRQFAGFHQGWPSFCPRPPRWVSQAVELGVDTEPKEPLEPFLSAVGWEFTTWTGDRFTWGFLDRLLAKTSWLICMILRVYRNCEVVMNLSDG